MATLYVNANVSAPHRMNYEMDATANAPNSIDDYDSFRVLNKLENTTDLTSVDETVGVIRPFDAIHRAIVNNGSEHRVDVNAE